MKNRKYFEIIGLLSVIGSLVFVGLEINQNTAAVRGATQQEISYQISEMYKIGVENDKIAFHFLCLINYRFGFTFAKKCI